MPKTSKSKEDQYTGPDLEGYFANRIDYFENITPLEKSISDELNMFVQKNLDSFDSKSDFINSQSNEFERQHTGFFVVAISFIIAGLLNLDASSFTSDTAKMFYLISMVSSLIAMFLLFIEFLIVKKFHSKWQNVNDDIIRYIRFGNWQHPRGLSEWIYNKQNTESLPKKSSSSIVYLEIFLVSLSLLSLGLLTVESTYDGLISIPLGGLL